MYAHDNEPQFQEKKPCEENDHKAVYNLIVKGNLLNVIGNNENKCRFKPRKESRNKI